MSRFTATVNFDTEFDGDKVEFVLRRFKNKHMIAIAPHFVQQDKTIIGPLKIIEAARESIQESVVSMKGLKDAAGNELQLSDILGEPYFAPLVDQLLVQLINISKPQDTDAKKSEAPQPDSMSAGNVATT